VTRPFPLIGEKKAWFGDRLRGHDETIAQGLERDLVAFQRPLPPAYDACEKGRDTSLVSVAGSLSPQRLLGPDDVRPSLAGMDSRSRGRLSHAPNCANWCKGRAPVTRLTGVVGDSLAPVPEPPDPLGLPESPRSQRPRLGVVVIVVVISSASVWGAGLGRRMEKLAP
jgi:hypothetical protein